jgi:hypothetical protein
MANWCFNTVTFTGEPDMLTKLTEYFYEMARQNEHPRTGRLPYFATIRRGWMYNFGWSGKFYFYATKSTPNTAVLIEIADRYRLDFRHEYEEMVNRIYGIATYENGELQLTEVDPEDFDEFRYNENTNTYEFENQHFDNCDEILQILLERKLNIQNLMI